MNIDNILKRLRVFWVETSGAKDFNYIIKFKLSHGEKPLKMRIYRKGELRNLIRVLDIIKKEKEIKTVEFIKALKSGY